MSRPIRSFLGRSKAVALRVWIVTRTGSDCRFVGPVASVLTPQRGHFYRCWNSLKEEQRAAPEAFSLTALAGVELSAAGRQCWHWINWSVVSHSSRKGRIITGLFYWRRRNLTALNVIGKSSTLFQDLDLSLTHTPSFSLSHSFPFSPPLSF